MILDEIANYLQAQGVGVKGASIILGSKGIIPDGDGPYITLIETGGSGPVRVQNYASAHVQRPTVQVVVRARRYDIARAKAKAAYLALDGVFNTTMGGVFYQSIVARQEPTDIGLDAKERPLVVFNIEVMKSPS